MRSTIRLALPMILVLSFGTACAPRGSRPGRSTTVITTGGDSGARRTGVPADDRSRSDRGQSPPGHDRDRATPADTRSRSDRGESPPGQDRDREERGQGQGVGQGQGGGQGQGNGRDDDDRGEGNGRGDDEGRGQGRGQR